MHFQNSPLIANKQATIRMKEALSLLGQELAKFELLGLEYSIYPRLLRSTQALKAATNQYQSDAYFHDIEQVAKDIDQLDSLGLLPYLQALKAVHLELKNIYQLSACIDRDFKSLDKARKNLQVKTARLKKRHQQHWHEWCTKFQGVEQWPYFQQMIDHILATIGQTEIEVNKIFQQLLQHRVSGADMKKSVQHIERVYEHLLQLSGAESSQIDNYACFLRYYRLIKEYRNHQKQVLPMHPFRFSLSMLMKQSVLVLLAILLWFHYPLVDVTDNYFIMVLMGIVGTDLVRTACSTQHHHPKQWLAKQGRSFHRQVMAIDLIQAVVILLISSSFIATSHWSMPLVLMLNGFAIMAWLYLAFLATHYASFYHESCKKVKQDLAFLHQYTQINQSRSLPLRKHKVMIKHLRGQLNLIQAGHIEYLGWCLANLDLSAVASPGR